MKRLLALSLPLFLLIPAYPTISLKLFQWREPWYRIPLEISGPIQIRKDPYGSGEFGAHRSGRRRHRGLDLTAPIGTNVLAAKSGKAWIGRVHSGMGRYVEIRHPDGWTTLYAHLKEIRIQDGQPIRRGEILGTVGKTGNARRRLIQPHLHFEIWNEGGTPVDPLSMMEAADTDA
ncbi:MAG: M23 family metallopeptidase [Candidatus Omnitrophica bacterium]|nr:M23 family metallopeptidase [Candidatus Omnitrophota bacterium]